MYCLLGAVPLIWFLFWAAFIAYTTHALGHLPRVMIDDPKLILHDDTLYQAMFDIIFWEGIRNPTLQSILCLAAAPIFAKALKHNMKTQLPACGLLVNRISLWCCITNDTLGIQFHLWLID